MATLPLPRPGFRPGGRAERVARSRPLRAVAADRRWLLPLFLVGYVLYATWTWRFPNWQGIPFIPLWASWALATAAVWTRTGRRLDPIAASAVVVVPAMLLTDVTLFWSQPLRDLVLYLKAADAWSVGAPVYAKVPLVAPVEDLSNYPFLYPPVTLPLFAALAALPLPAAAALWLGASLAAVLAGLRWIGFGWRWCLLFLAWPPVTQGLYVGNVALPMFALFAAAVWRPALLVLPPFFKIYSGIAGLWLLRREHRRELAMGVALVAVLVLVTLPVTGIPLWLAWLEGLEVYRVSQQLLPQYLYGFGLGRFVPLPVLAILGGALVLLAFRARERREQLSRLGVAVVAASPSLFSHGWLVALPALARLETPWFWLAFGLTACSPGTPWFIALGVVGLSWFRPELRKRPGDDPWHPLGPAAEPWPKAAPPPSP